MTRRGHDIHSHVDHSCLIIRPILQSIPLEELCSEADWDCYFKTALSDESIRSYRRNILTVFSPKADLFLSLKFTKRLDECLNAEDKREMRGGIIPD